MIILPTLNVSLINNPNSLPPLQSKYLTSSTNTLSSLSSPSSSSSPPLRQIYEGQKLYWRQRVSVDFNIFSHHLDHLIEVISYHSDQGQELNRIYLNSDIIWEYIQEDFKTKLEEMKKELSKDRFKKVPNDEELKMKVGDGLITQFILNRLTVVNENNVNLMKFSLSSGESVSQSFSHTLLI